MSRHVRVWDEVHTIYKDVAEKEGFILGDLISAVLLEAAQNEGVVIKALLEWFEDVSPEEALSAARRLREHASSLIAQLEKLIEQEEVEAHAKKV